MPPGGIRTRNPRKRALDRAVTGMDTHVYCQKFLDQNYLKTLISTYYLTAEGPKFRT